RGFRSGSCFDYNCRRASDNRVGRDILRDYAVGANDATFADHNSLQNKNSCADPRSLADSDGLNVCKIGRTAHNSHFCPGRVSIIVRNLAIAGYQDIILNNYLAVAGDCHVVPDERSTADAQGRTIRESTRADCKIATEPNIVTDVEQCVSVDAWHCGKLETLADRLTTAAKYRLSIDQSL